MKHKPSQGQTQLIIIGYGGHAKVIEDCVRSCVDLALLGYIDVIDRQVLLDRLGSDDDIASIRLKHPNARFVLGVGDLNLRRKLIETYEAQGAVFETVIHGTAFVGSGARVGQGTVVFPRAVINADSQVGRHCIVNTGAIVEHDNVLSDNVHIGPGAVTGGQVRIGTDTLIGLGAVVRNNLKIGEKCIVGCGTVLVKDVQDHALVYGVPGKQRG